MKVYKRKLFDALRTHVFKDEVTVLTGSRQVGKSTLLKQLNDELTKEGFSCYYFTLENKRYKKILDSNPENLFNIVPPVGGSRIIVFIDEIQYLDDPTNFLKLFYDEYRGRVKLVVTGSSAFYIDRKFKDSLSGRKKLFHLGPFSFVEMLESIGEKDLLAYVNLGVGVNTNVPLIFLEKLQQYANEYAVYGGYPKVVLTTEVSEKIEILNELKSSYLKKDALESNVRKETEFILFVEALALRVGSRLNRQELCSLCGISDETAQNYLYILQKSFHISYVRPFWKSKSSELRKMPKIYFQDNGLLNAFLNDFSPLTLRKDKGELVENLAYSMLRQYYDEQEIQFWITREQKEVDFIIKKEKALEVKFSTSSIRESKYKLFRNTYPEMNLSFITQMADEKYPSLWRI